MLSITAVSRYHAVLRQPAYRPVSAVPRLRNVKTVTRSPLLEELAATVLSSVRSRLRRAGRILSITHIGYYHTVLRQPAYRPVSAVPRLRNVKTVTRSAPARRSRGVVLSYIRACVTRLTGC